MVNSKLLGAESCLGRPSHPCVAPERRRRLPIRSASNSPLVNVFLTDDAKRTAELRPGMDRSGDDTPSQVPLATRFGLVVRACTRFRVNLTVRSTDR